MEESHDLRNKLLAYVVKRLIRIYTPFICALIALIHGVLVLNEVDGVWMNILGEVSGHSLFMLAYVWATSSHMCKWYHYTIFLLFMTHISNIMYYYDIVIDDPVHIIVILNILSLLCFLIYRKTVGITKILCLYRTH